MSAFNDTWEYRTEVFHIEDHQSDFNYNNPKTGMSQKLDVWGKEGWEVISVVCPQPSNYTKFRVFAKRRIGCTTF